MNGSQNFTRIEMSNVEIKRIIASHITNKTIFLLFKEQLFDNLFIKRTSKI